MNKVVIIGIDGMDPDCVLKWKSDLPNLSKFRMSKMKSVFPPDSISAWVTIFTGLNPAQHGILHSIDYLTNRSKDFSIDTNILRGRTFWDIASKSGRRVCIINPFLAYPPWYVNGVMVSGPVFITGAKDAFPRSILKKYSIPPLGGIVDFPTSNMLWDFFIKSKKDTEDLADFGIRLLKEQNWDLYFITFLTLDRIQHFFWRYSDEGDPTYPGKNCYQNVIKEFYQLFDEIVGEFASFIDENTVLLVISDHGHGRRCTKSLNLNEFLRKEGYLAPKIKGIEFLQPKYWMERAKTSYLNFVYRYSLEDITMKIARFIPKKGELKKSTYITDFDDSLAWVDKNFSGMNPFGGVRLNRLRIEKENLNYDKVRKKIMQDIAHLRDPKNGRQIVKWIRRREEIYQGEFISKYPDIVFELNEEYGLGFSLYLPIVSLNVTHKKISGGHKKYGVFFSRDMNAEIDNMCSSILCVTPTIFNILGIKGDDRFNREAILKNGYSSD
ncbi:hypothetical protein BXT86_01145 [candidate division WOR-3 bacterium 4484_100]|uniref:Phosphodiesterase n=1 Tax=candidate division WOR-3 bacterium 4484_100 TaxID=1936077 RepID=A0A1V4QGE8_UNCW3|nr:MAG: hypothetical protein BXT86_01145 [candidate division WOR-3 bacterium 4484_100]